MVAVKANNAGIAERVSEAHLEDRVHEDYGDYSIAVNEDRAFCGDVDGLKPVGRRVLWAVFHDLHAVSTAKYIKAAKAVGDTMGNYHPHGDSSIYGAITTMVNCAVPMIDGQGNWGWLDDEPAAMRYTEMRLSPYAERVFFDRFYLPLTQLVPNYDDSNTEPLQLLALLPNLIINGNSGIGVGFATNIPSYTLASIVKLLKTVIAAGGKCTPQHCMKLEFNVKLGGVAVIDTEQARSELLRFYKTGKGGVKYHSVGGLHNNELKITGFAPINTMENRLARVLGYPGVAQATDTSDHTEVNGSVLVRFKRGVDRSTINKLTKRILQEAFGVKHSYDFKFTRRFIQDETAQARMRAETMPQVIDRWIKYRLQLERDACSYWIEETDKDIARLNLLRLAIKHIDLIVKALKMRQPDAVVVKWLAKQMKITPAQAEAIFEMKVRQLRALEDVKLVAGIKAAKEKKRELLGRRKRPQDYVPKQLDQMLAAILPRIKRAQRVKPKRR